MKKILTYITAVIMIAGYAQAFMNAPESFSSVVKKTKNGVVNISTTKFVERRNTIDDYFEKFFGDKFSTPKSEPKKFKTSALGSGFVISEDGLIVTNNHVIDGASEIIVKFNDKTQYDAVIIGRDPLTDLAVIKVTPKNGERFQVLPLGDSDEQEIGDWMIAIGNPLGLEWTVTAGILSARGRALGSGPYDDFLQTDTSINPGNSGGPLINIKGEVVGINTAIIPSAQGLGFSVPVNMLKELLPQLKKGSVKRGWLGVSIQPLDENLAKSFGLKDAKGALIAEVMKGDPADKAGLKAGDVVVGINGEQVDDSKQLVNIVGRLLPDSVAKLDIYRDGKKMAIDVKLGTRDGGVEVKNDAVDKNESDINVKEIPDELKKRLDINSGVIVTSVDQDSDAFEKGLRDGDIITWMDRNTISTPAQFYKIYDSVKAGDLVSIKVINRGGVKFVAFKKK